MGWVPFRTRCQAPSADTPCSPERFLRQRFRGRRVAVSTYSTCKQAVNVNSCVMLINRPETQHKVQRKDVKRGQKVSLKAQLTVEEVFVLSSSLEAFFSKLYWFVMSFDLTQRCVHVHVTLMLQLASVAHFSCFIHCSTTLEEPQK